MGFKARPQRTAGQIYLSDYEVPQPAAPRLGNAKVRTKLCLAAVVPGEIAALVG
jgi:hypothetical protein